MTDRRRNPRFVLRAVLEGRLRFNREVLVERYDAEGLIVLSRTPAVQGEVLQIGDISLKPPLAFGVQVEESTPTIVTGTIHHRVRLRRSGNAIQPADIMAYLVSEVPVRLRDMCRTGCLLESPAPLVIEATAELIAMLGSHVSSALVKVKRSQGIPGRASGYHIGAEFLSRGSRGTSLPLAVDRLVREEEWTEFEPTPKGQVG